MSVTARVIAEGSRYTISEIVIDGRSYVMDFFNGLPKEQAARLVRLLEFIVDHGAPRNETKFRHEEDGIYAIKQGQARVYCFFDAGRFILLTHGAVKKRRKANPEDLARAKRLRKAYLGTPRM